MESNLNSLQFVNPNIPSLGKQLISSGSRYLSGKQFAKQFSKMGRPIINPSIQITFAGNNNDSGSDGNGSNGSKGKSGNRPHKSKTRAVYPMKEPKTTNIRFNSGIKSGTLVNDREEPSSSSYSTLFTLGGTFFESLDSNSYYSNLLEDIYYRYLRKVQASVNVNAAKTFTKSKFSEYIYSLSNALQLYYMVESILAYSQNPSNKNEGMLFLRNKFDSNLMSQHERLRRFLITCPIPKKLMEFICYMYSNFSFSNYDNSVIFRLEFRDTLHTTGLVLSELYYDVIISSIFDCNEVTSLLLKSIPSLGIIDLDFVSNEVIYDENFLTFWHNSDHTMQSYSNKNNDGYIVHSRVVENYDEEFPYYQFTDIDIDGIFYACSSYHNYKTKCDDPGLWRAYHDPKRIIRMERDERSNLLCYDRRLGRMTSPSSEGTLAQSGLNKCLYLNIEQESITKKTFILPNTKKIQVNNLLNLKGSLSEAVLLLLDT